MAGDESIRDQSGLSVSGWARIDAVVDQFEQQWQQAISTPRRGAPPTIDARLQGFEGSERYRLFRELMLVECEYRRRGRLPIQDASFLQHIAEFCELISELLAGQGLPNLEDASSQPTAAAVLPLASGAEQATIEFAGTELEMTPRQIGRYRVEELLGRGGFGCVYLATDEQLNRPVAIKVPHARYVRDPLDAHLYLEEARIVAHLDHPYITPVYDVGSTPECPCYIVSKFIAGGSLRETIRSRRLDFERAASLIARIADALHYAHKNGVVHRDVKPGNILLDKEGHAFLADFGVAIRDPDFGRGPRYVGTPSYMSPEQARGEGHRVDGRSDVYSLGVVLFELLTGRLPVEDKDVEKLLERIATGEVRPPRQIDEAIPKSLERICLKALGRRASERYSTAHDMATELRNCLAVAPAAAEIPRQRSADVPAEATGRAARTKQMPVIPKGLRPFDEHDSDFFLQLLPGPRDWQGLPESIRFWKHKIEQTDASSNFTTGVIYGPSGCGKSSFVRAGLLPRLDPEIKTVYLEATPGDTEERLHQRLCQSFPWLGRDASLPHLMADLRCSLPARSSGKLLIVLDQFEQWLQGRSSPTAQLLVDAIRQCDGDGVRTLVLVRDDFWLALSRFMAEVEVRLLERDNVMLLDLFDASHARRTLLAFGRAFGRLPEEPEAPSADQQRFLTEAVDGLAKDGRVVCVGLALFAEMMKGYSWTCESLRSVGGATGIGLKFLEQTFESPAASPALRYHADAARKVLKALAPADAGDLKSYMQPRQVLLEASGYAARPQDFATLMSLLDTEVRLITLTDQTGSVAEPESVAGSVDSGQTDREPCYQLTHDYLVTPLRQWLMRAQLQTRRGRAELRLAEHSALWAAKPETRRLPPWWQYLSICLWTRRSSWTRRQQQMMTQAGRVVARRAAVLILAAALLTWGLVAFRSRTVATALVDGFLQADIASVPAQVAELNRLSRWTAPQLQARYASLQGAARLRAAIALVQWSDRPQLVQYLADYATERATAEEVAVISRQLAPQFAASSEPFWQLLRRTHVGDEMSQLRTATVLAICDADSPLWTRESCRETALRLVSLSPNSIGSWIENLRPIRQRLTEPLVELARADVTGNVDATPLPQILAVQVLAEYARQQVDILVDVAVHARREQFLIVFPLLEQNRDEAIRQLNSRLALEADTSSSETDTYQRANAAIALIRLGADSDAWKLLGRSSENSLKSQLTDRLHEFHVPPQTLVDQLRREIRTDVRRSLILALGEYRPEEVRQSDADLAVQLVTAAFQEGEDAGLQGAAEWLLKRWNLASEAERMNSTLPGLSEVLAGAAPHQSLRCKSKLGHTFTAIIQPDSFVMGSPDTGPDQLEGEGLRTLEIPRSFAIATTEVTWEEFAEFYREFYGRPFGGVADMNPAGRHRPAGAVTWYDAARYCNWLTQKEGLPASELCFSDEGNTVRPEVDYLQRQGYRLPSEAEWEYACRAGTTADRFCAGRIDTLRGYGWFDVNANGHSHAVAQLKPNDLGLFDIYGNVMEWCLDPYVSYREEVRIDREHAAETFANTDRRVLRGGSFDLNLPNLRSAKRFWYPAGLGGYNVTGFRLARSL